MFGSVLNMYLKETVPLITGKIFSLFYGKEEPNEMMPNPSIVKIAETNIRIIKVKQRWQINLSHILTESKTA